MLHVGGIVSRRQVSICIRSNVGYSVQRILDLAYNRWVYIYGYRIARNIVGTVRHYGCCRLDVYARIYSESLRRDFATVGIFHINSIGLSAVQVLVQEQVLHEIGCIV
ncbi:hypothetical protein D3C72_359890 [compost metagenome]